MAVSVEKARLIEGAAAGRRRPGRKDASPKLIPLLRTLAEGEKGLEDLPRLLGEEGEINADPIAPARGIALAVALAVPIWALLLGGGYALLK